MTKEEKIARARVLRDAALIILRKAGAWESAGPVKLVSAHIDAITIGYRTPFQHIPDPDDVILKSYATLIGASIWRNGLPYGLDISAAKKVLCIEWDDQGAVFLDSFWPGSWEAEVIAAAERDTVLRAPVDPLPQYFES